MARRRYQSGVIHKTKAKRPQWYFRARVDVLVGPGERDRKGRFFYLGFCDEMGKREAEKQRDSILAEAINQPRVLIQSQVKFADVIAAYKRDHLPTLREVSRRTYECRIDKWIAPFLGDLRLCDITPQIVQRWCNENLPKTTSLKKAVVGHFRLVWNRARAWGYTHTADPSEFVAYGPQRVGFEKQIPTLEQLQAIRMNLTVDNPVLGDMFDMAIGSGMRISEIRGLTVGQCDFARSAVMVTRRIDNLNEVDVPKSSRGKRALPMGELKPMLEQRCKGIPADALVFPIGCYDTAQDHLREAAKAAGYEQRGFGWHSLRRAHNTWFRKSGGRVEDARDQLGHATTQVNDLYLVAESEDFERRAELVRLVQAKVMGGIQ